MVLLLAVALAAPPDEALKAAEPLGDGVFRVHTSSPDALDAALEDAVGEAPDAGRVRLVDGAGRDPTRRPPTVPDKGERTRIDHPGAHDGFLSGKAVYLSQCHGWIWYDSLGGFSTQRGNVYDTVEDYHNPEGADQFLAPLLENAGARVFTARERDMTSALAIADNDGAGYAESGSGFADGEAGFAERSSWAYGENPFRAGTTRTFPSDGGGVATWTPDVPSDGDWAVYVTWDSNAAHASDAHYRIHHPGGVIDRWYDQGVHGSTWQYLDTLWLPAGQGGLVVELIGDSSEHALLSADAVRVGGGMGDVTRHGRATGRPRWEEGATQYVQYNGAPTSVYDPYGDGDGSDPSARSRWAAWEHPSGEDAVYLSWHSNACGSGGDCTARGTVTYYYDSTCASGAPVTGSGDLAQDVNDELVDAFRALWEPDWAERGSGGTAKACFSEVSPGHNPEMPSALVELAFHNNVDDVEFLKHPAFRRDAARAMYRGIVRYFAERDGVTPVFLPEPPVAVSVTHDAQGRLVATWRPGPSGAPYGDALDHYRVFTSKDGRSWDNGSDADGERAVLDAPGGQPVFVRVAAVNGGGISLPSEVAGGLRSSDGAAAVLIVSAFDRLDTGLLDQVDVGGSVGVVLRMDLGRMNPGESAVAHGVAIGAAGWPFDTVADEALDSVDLSTYRLVVWIAGEESTADETFSAAQQDAIRAFFEGGGAVWASGAELLWDLDARGSDADRAFAADVLGATYAADDAGTTLVDGAGLLADLALDFGPDHGGPYPVEYPDAILADGDPVATYDGGAVAGALGERAFVLGFPFEAIGDPAVRAEVAARVLPALVPDYEPPDPDPIDDGPDREPLRRGCGCDGSGAVAAPWLLLGALGVRRRRALPGGP